MAALALLDFPFSLSQFTTAGQQGRISVKQDDALHKATFLPLQEWAEHGNRPSPYEVSQGGCLKATGGIFLLVWVEKL